MTRTRQADPRPWFVEYLHPGLAKETSEWLTTSIEGAIGRFNDFVGKKVCVPSSPTPAMQCVPYAACWSRTRRWISRTGAQPMHLTTGARTSSRRQQTRRVFGCHCTSRQLSRTPDLCARTTSLAKELVGKEYATVLYCSTRWSSVNHMFLRLNQVKDATISIRGVGSADRNPGQIETAFTAPGELSRLTKDPAFWKRIDHALRVFDPTCKMIGILECNSATMAIAYASFLFVRVHIEAAFTSNKPCWRSCSAGGTRVLSRPFLPRITEGGDRAARIRRSRSRSPRHL